jgi:hypothetical protein
MDFPLYLSESDLMARLYRIAGKDEPVSDDIGADTVILLIRLNLAVGELTRAVKALATQK